MRIAMLGVMAVLLCVACKPEGRSGDDEAQGVTKDYPVQPPRPRPPLPPGEEYVPTPQAPTLAQAMLEPLQPSAEDIAAKPMTPDDIRRWEAGVRFNRGETVDLNGNGKPDHFGSWAKGYFTYTIDENEDGKPDETFDGITMSADTNLDGRPDLVETKTVRPNGGSKEVIETDKDSDGVLDERYTIEQLAPMKRRRKLERLKGGRWEVEYDLVGSPVDTMQKTQGSELDGEQVTCQTRLAYRFPSNIGEPSIGNGAVRIPFGGPRRCSLTQANKLFSALSCVERKVVSCLPKLNPEVAARVRRLVGSTMPQVAVSCTGVCPNIRGGTWFGLDFGGGVVRTAIEMPTTIESDSPDAACETMFHELMHAARVPQGPNHDTAGDDVIYGCSRVCANCSHASLGAGDDHKDCAACASPVNLKVACGVNPTVTAKVLPEDPSATCVRVANGEMSFAPCTARLEVDFLNCDGTQSNVSSSCCEACPAGFGEAGSGGFCSGLRFPNTCQGPLRLCGT